MPRSSTSGGGLLRRLGWAIVGVMVVGLAFSWQILLIRYPWLLAGLAGIPALCFIWLWSTSQRERSAYERFVFTAGGIARLPYTMKEGETNIDTVFVAWGDADAFQLKRVGPFWKRLLVGTRGSGNVMERVVFDAGIRCPDAQAQMVIDALNTVLNRHVALRKDGEAGEGIATMTGARVPEGGQTGPS